MANFNKVILMGNLTRSPETKFTQAGMAVCKFGLAVNRRTSSKNGEQKESTCFVDCTAFGKSAELLQEHVQKGSQLFVDGRLEFSQWEAKDGSKRSKLEVIVENFQFMGSRDRGDQPGRRSGGGRERQAGAGQGQDNGDIPF